MERLPTRALEPSATNGDVLTTVAGAVEWRAPSGSGGGGGASGLDDLGVFNGIYGSVALGTDDEFDRAGNPTSLPAGWSWVNQGTSTYREQGSRGIIAAQGGGESLRLIVKALPSASTWTAIAKVSAPPWSGAWHRAALVLRSSSGGQFVQYGLVQQGGMHLNKWNNATSFNAAISENNATGMLPMDNVHFRVVKNADGTLSYAHSIDGFAWLPVATQAPPWTFDQIGFLVGSPSNGREGSIDWLRMR